MSARELNQLSFAADLFGSAIRPGDFHDERGGRLAVPDFLTDAA